mmetsp:Transcript_20241/g.32516  ORF Transcript_20241/g.32516 Transcript_20241/m.32516 type:complete len:624 (+) Transcript_20241:139-2010(+)
MENRNDAKGEVGGSRENVSAMDEMELIKWLAANASALKIRPNIIKAIEENELTGGDLLKLTKDEVNELVQGKIGPRKQLNSLVETLNNMVIIKGPRQSASNGDGAIESQQKEVKLPSDFPTLQSRSSSEYGVLSSQNTLPTEDVGDDTKSRASSSSKSPSQLYGFPLYQEDDLEMGKVLGEGNFARSLIASIKDQEKVKYVIKIPKNGDFKEDVGEFAAFLHLKPHPNVLTLEALVLIQGKLCFLTPLCEKGSLDVLHKSLELSHGQGFLQVTKDIAKGLQHLHSLQLVHRDIACRNILLTKDGTAKIADFGLTRFAPKNSAYIRNVSNVAWPWMAPESVGKSGSFTSASDIWSLGVTIWELLTKGCEPYNWKGQSYKECLERIVQGKEQLECPENASSFERALLKSCLNIDLKLRPSAEMICRAIEEKNESLLVVQASKKSGVTTQNEYASYSSLDEVSSYYQKNNKAEIESKIVREATLKNLKSKRSFFAYCIHLVIDINTKQVCLYRKLWKAMLITPMGTDGQSTLLTPTDVWNAVRIAVRKLGEGYVMEIGKSYKGRYVFIERMTDSETNAFLDALKSELKSMSNGVMPKITNPVGLVQAQGFFTTMAVQTGCLASWLN